MGGWGGWWGAVSVSTCAMAISCCQGLQDGAPTGAELLAPALPCLLLLKPLTGVQHNIHQAVIQQVHLIHVPGARGQGGRGSQGRGR